MNPLASHSEVQVWRWAPQRQKKNKRGGFRQANCVDAGRG